MLKIFVLFALLTYLSGKKVASNNGWVTVKSWPEPKSTETEIKHTGTRWVIVDENESKPKDRAAPNDDFIEVINWPEQSEETEIKHPGTRWISVDETAPNDGFIEVIDWAEPTDETETNQTGTRWINVDEDINSDDETIVIELEDTNPTRQMTTTTRPRTTTRRQTTTRPRTTTTTPRTTTRRQTTTRPRPTTTRPRTTTTRPRTTTTADDGFIKVQKWPEPNLNNTETNQTGTRWINVDEDINSDDETIVIELEDTNLDNQENFDELNIPNDDFYGGYGDDSYSTTTSTKKPSSTEVTKKKDCSPRSKDLKKAMFEWGYSNPQPLDEISKKVCPKTCKAQDMEWKGVYSSLDGNEVTTCQCEKLLPLNKYSSNSSNEKIDMRKCEMFFCDAMLNLHNDYRTKHRVGNLTADDDLSMQANEYALKLVRLGKLEKSKKNEVFGENLVMRNYIDDAPALNSDICYDMGRKATAIWYDQSKDYDYKKCDSKSGGEAIDEFTQLVWKNTTIFGCGLATDLKGRNFVAVARYSPPGNTKGQYEVNVLKPISSLNLIGWPFVNA